MQLIKSKSGSLNTLRIEHDDGAVETYAITRGGVMVFCTGEAELAALVHEAEMEKVEGFSLGWSNVGETMEIAPRVVCVEVGTMSSFSSTSRLYLLGLGAARPLGGTDSSGQGGPGRLDMLLAVNSTVCRAAISYRGSVLGILDIQTRQIVSMNIPARPGHKLALASERPLVAVCGPHGHVHVLSTETAEIVFHRDLVGVRPRRPRFDEREETLLVDTSNETIQLSLQVGA